MFAIKNIEGQKKAIENGWGMNELNLLGNLSEFKYALDIQKNILKEECNPEFWENKKNIISQKISSQQALVEQNRRELEEAKALNNKTQDELSRMESYLRNSERQLDNYRRDYNKLGTREEDTRKKYNELNAISQKIDKVYNNAMNKDIETLLDKIEIADEYEKVLKEVGKIAVDDKTSNAGKSVETVQKKAEEGLLAVKNSMEYAGRKPVPVYVLEDHVLPEKEFSDYNALFCLKSTTSVDMNLVQGIDKFGKNCFLSVTNPYRYYLESEDHFYNITDHNNFITGPLKDQYHAPLIKYKLPNDKAEREEVIKLGEDTLRQLEALFCEKMSKDTSDEKELRRYTASLAELADIEKGELLTAMIDQPILVNVLAQAGCGINMYKDGAEKVTKQWMQERNLLEPYLAFCDAGKELTSAEYEKQHMKRSGWDAKKEKQYLARLDECYDKMIKGFEACFDAPQEAQNEKGIIANSLGEITGNTYNDGARTITAEITGLKWMREGIKQGWDSKDLQCLFHMGTVEGYIEGSITTSLRKAENLAGDKDKEQEEKDWRAKAVILQEFKDKELKPFKESLLGMKIKSPQDKLKAVTMIQGFYEKYKNYPILKHDDEVDLNPIKSKVSVFVYL